MVSYFILRFEFNTAGCVGNVGEWIVVSCFILGFEFNTAGCVGNVGGCILIFVSFYVLSVIPLDVSVM